MRIFSDYQGRHLRLTDERLSHILERPEMRGLDSQIERTIANPELVVQSLSDPAVSLFYTLQEATIVGAKWLCVVVKTEAADPFVLTAYLTDKPKRGDHLWPPETSTR